MAYEKQTFVDNVTVLTSEILSHMDNGIFYATELAERVSLALSALESRPSTRIGEITLKADKWDGSNNLYSQIVAIDGVTPNSQVDITPSVEQLAVFYEKDITFVTENDNGIVKVFVIGQKPQNDYTLQVTILEVK